MFPLERRSAEPEFSVAGWR